MNIPPTIREVAEAMDVESTATSTYWILILETLGWITRRKKITRSIRLTQEGLVVLGRAS
jgi:SOS-response transcriptional repressor LexA